MKYFLQIIISILPFAYGNAQPSNRLPEGKHILYYSPSLEFLDTLQIKEGDFQLRFRYSDGGNRVNTTYLLLLTFKDKNWNVQNLTITSFPRQIGRIRVQEREALKLDYDSIYRQLLKDSLLTISSNNINFNPRNTNNIFVWSDAGPTNYKIEILTASERKTLSYKCPKFFYTQYHIEELKTPLKIISLLIRLMNLVDFKEPC